jgi:hypothetical protein
MNPASAGDDDRRILQQLLGRGGPAFVRRAKRMEDAERALLDRLCKKRDENLSMVRLRIGQLRALAGDWNALRPFLGAEYSLDSLRELHDVLRPELRLPLKATRSPRVLRHALIELKEAIERFNCRWQKCLDECDLTAVNLLRDGYNKHYVLEKECALGDARVARMGFRRLDPLTIADLATKFPIMPIPALARP